MLVKVLIKTANINGNMYKQGDILDIPCDSYYTGLISRRIVQDVHPRPTRDENPHDDVYLVRRNHEEKTTKPCHSYHNQERKWLAYDDYTLCHRDKLNHRHHFIGECKPLPAPIDVSLKPKKSSRAETCGGYSSSCSTEPGHRHHHHHLEPKAHHARYSHPHKYEHCVTNILEPRKNDCLLDAGHDAHGEACSKGSCFKHATPHKGHNHSGDHHGHRHHGHNHLATCDSRETYNCVDPSYCTPSKKCYRPIERNNFTFEYPVGDESDMSLCLSMELDKLLDIKQKTWDILDCEYSEV